MEMINKTIVLFLILIPFIENITLSRKEFLDYAVRQYTRVTETTRLGIDYITETSPLADKWTLTQNTTGHLLFSAAMYPGDLWLLYHLTGNHSWKDMAIKATDGMYSMQFVTRTHDIGFGVDNSYGLGYDFTKNSSYPAIIINGAKHMAIRYSEKVGCIRSWNSPDHPGEFWVIVDNMMNVELLFRAHLLSGNHTFYEMAVSHTNKTIENHLRKDHSSWHVVAFNETTGAVVRKFTAQGYSDSSCWSRGQAWLINGFMTTYKYTKLNHILEAAKNVANYYIDNLPEDGIPFWDFNVPKDKYAYIPRDSSSAAIASSGLFELYIHTNETKYLLSAQKIMSSLFSSKYRANGKKEYKLPALIANGTVSGPNAAHGKHDLVLTYGDYYFLKSFQYLN